MLMGAVFCGHNVYVETSAKSMCVHATKKAGLTRLFKMSQGRPNVTHQWKFTLIK